MHMAELIPSRPLTKSTQPRAIPVAGQADLLSLEYAFDGQQKTLKQFVEESSTLEASVTSLPPRLFQLLPAGTTIAGWEFHPLRNDAFHGALKYWG